MPVADLFSQSSNELLAAWVPALLANDGRLGTSDARELEQNARQLLDLLGTAAREDDTLNAQSAPWQPVRVFLEQLSATRARQGYTSSQTATFVFSLKQPVFELLRRTGARDADRLTDDIWEATTIIDAMGLQTVAAFQRTREEVIARQQEDMLELSTPVVKLWDGILALPMIGTLDSARTQVVMESLLQRIVDTGSEIAILDITGVPTVDTLVAQHLLKTATAIRLMGGDCIISGVRPQIAQTIVHLGVDLRGITTKATLADALALALKRTGQAVVKTPMAVAS
jgi:rsbT co-antagonist protein RsbR